MLVQIDKGWRGSYLHKGAQLKAGTPENSRLSREEFLTCFPTILRSTFIGIGIGSIPGMGASLSSFLAYAWTKRRDKDPDSFGKGRLEGVAAAESADNASMPAGLIPMFAIGLPSSASAALLMGAFMLNGLTPGPFLFRDDAVLVYSIFAGMILASGIMLIMGMVGQNLFARMISVSEVILVPIIVFLCVVGAYLEGSGMFSVYLMLVFAFLGYFMKKYDFSFITFLIGFILGPIAELSLRQAMIITDGKISSLTNHPIAILFLVLAALSIWSFASAGTLQERTGAAPEEP
jgi:putative tricarboxylic transport membrane protein